MESGMHGLQSGRKEDICTDKKINIVSYRIVL